MRIATLDQAPDQLELIGQRMEALDHECHGFTSGKTLLRELRQQSFDLLILDGNLPDLTGPQLVRWVRFELASRVPILLVMHGTSEQDMVDALLAGADDFMGKPLRMGELEARVGALLRRAYPTQHEPDLSFGPYRFLSHTRTLEMNGEVIELKHREYELALFLFQNLGRLLSREHLREAVWGLGPETPSRSLDTHVSRLRTKLDLRPETGFLLSAIYGLGYRLEAVDASLLRPHSYSPANAAA